MTIKDLHTTEFHEYYRRYIFKLSDELPLIGAFVEGKKSTVDFFKGIPADKHSYRYEHGKWSVKEVFQHLIDTERIFMYRCFRIARRDETPLSGFDQNIYIEPSNANNKDMEALITEFQMLQDSSISLLKSLSGHDLMSVGNSNGSPMSARAAAFVIPGHNIWHMNVIKEKYLQ